MRREIFSKSMISFGNIQVWPYIVGDSAFPLLANIINPFTASGLGDAQKDDFDKAMRRDKVKIDQQFTIDHRVQPSTNISVEMTYIFLGSFKTSKYLLG